MARIFDTMAAKALGAALLYAPRLAADPLTNQGDLALPAGVLKNGLALVVPGQAKGCAAAALDGVDDYIDTGWPTRTNMLLQPSPEVANTQWGGAGGFFNNAATITRDTATAQFNGTACWKIVTTGVAVTEGAATGGGVALVKNKTYWASAYVKGAVGGEQVELGLGGAATGFALSGPVTLSATEWKRITVKLKATETGAGAVAMIGAAVAGKKAQTFYFDCTLLEEGETLGSFFPTVGQLAPWSPTNPEGGLAGWSGTAYESVSDFGPFARGTARTFVGLANRTNSATGDAFLGGPGGRPLFWLLEGTQTVKWLPDEATPSEWVAAWPGNGVAASYALMVDDPNNTAALYVNGALVSSKANAGLMHGNANQEGNLLIGANGGTNFLGALLPFAVFPRALSAAELEAVLPQQRMRVTERPPMRQYVLATTPGGAVHRWGEDEPRAEDVLQNFDDEDTVPGGFKQATGSLPRKPGIDYTDMVMGTHLEIVGAGGRTIGEYRLERAPRTSGDYLTMDPAAFGYQAHLDDDTSAQGIPIDADLSAWSDMSTQRKINMLEAGYDPSKTSVSTAFQDAGATAPAILISISEYGTKFELGESWYYGGGVQIGRVRYDFIVPKPGGDAINQGNQLFLGQDDLAAGAEAGTSHHQTPATDQVLPIGGGLAAAGFFYALIQCAFFGAFEGPSAGDTFGFTNVRVFDRSGIPVYGTWPKVGVLASDVIAYGVRTFAPLLNLTTTGEAATVRPTEFLIPHLPFKEPGPVSGWISAANRFELNEWAVWANQTFYLNPRGERIGRKRWRARVRPTKLKDTGQQMDRVWNGVIVEYQDVDGTTKIIGPPGSGYRLIDARLADADPLNPANQIPGLRRWTKVVLKSQSTSEGAIRTGQIFLELTKELDGSGSAIFDGYIEDENGREWPYYCANSGDLVDFVDSSISGDRYMVACARKRGDRQAEITLDAPKDAMEALLEQLDVVLVPIGFGTG